jgi:hypothetical protein
MMAEQRARESDILLRGSRQGIFHLHSRWFQVDNAADEKQNLELQIPSGSDVC